MSSILRNREAVVKSMEGARSKRDMLHNLGLRSAGGNYASLDRSLVEFGLIPPRFPRSAPVPKRLTEEEIFIEGKDTSVGARRWLMQREGRGKFCEMESCSLKNEWNGQPLVMQMDHTDGIRTNNLRSNLRFICPNCHSQTSTFAGKGIRSSGKIRTLN